MEDRSVEAPGVIRKLVQARAAEGARHTTVRATTAEIVLFISPPFSDRRR